MTKAIPAKAVFSTFAIAEAEAKAAPAMGFAERSFDFAAAIVNAHNMAPK